MDWNVKKMATFFRLFLCVAEMSIKLIVLGPLRKSPVIFHLVILGAFYERQRYLVSVSVLF